MLHVQIHPFLVQTLPPPPLLSLSLFNPLHASFSSRLLSLAPDSLSVPRTHARTHTPARINTNVVGRSVIVPIVGPPVVEHPRKSFDETAAAGWLSPSCATTIIIRRDASTARVGKDNEEREASRESMPRSQLDVVLRVRIGLTPLKRGVRVPRWKSAYLFLSFFLFIFFSFLFFSLVPVLTTTLHGPFRVLNISGASTTKPCSQHGSPSLKKKREKRKNEKKKKGTRASRGRARFVRLPLVLLLSLAIKLIRLLFTGFLYAFVSSSFYTILCSLPPPAHRRPFCRPVSRLPDRRGWRGTPPFRIHAIR